MKINSFIFLLSFLVFISCKEKQTIAPQLKKEPIILKGAVLKWQSQSGFVTQNSTKKEINSDEAWLTLEPIKETIALTPIRFIERYFNTFNYMQFDTDSTGKWDEVNFKYKIVGDTLSIFYEKSNIKQLKYFISKNGNIFSLRLTKSGILTNLSSNIEFENYDVIIMAQILETDKITKCFTKTPQSKYFFNIDKHIVSYIGQYMTSPIYFDEYKFNLGSNSRPFLIEKYSANGPGSYTKKYFCDSNGRVNKSIEYTRNHYYDIDYITAEYFQYNSKNQLIKKSYKSDFSNFSFEYEYENGNLVKEYVPILDNTGKVLMGRRISKEYKYSSLINKYNLPFIINYGTPNTNLIKEITSYSNSGQATIMKMNPEIDANGYVIKDINGSYEVLCK